MTKQFLQPIKRNVILADKRTSLQLEQYIWWNLELIATLTDQPSSLILNKIKAARQSSSMAQSVRLFCLFFQTDYAQRLANNPELGHNPMLSTPLLAAEYSFNRQLVQTTFDDTLALIYVPS